MPEEDPGEFSIADTVRAMAKEVGDSLERMLDHLELDEPAASFGIDPARAREWAETAGSWLRAHVEEAGDELATWVAGREEDADSAETEPGGARDREAAAEPAHREDPHAPEESPFRSPPRLRRATPPGPRGRPRRPGGRARPLAADPLRGAGPNPLDTPTSEQGQALAALDSGRWMLEPGTEALTASGEGPGPSDALGLVRELRVRDWIAADGKLTLAGRRALSRWLDAVS
jgi:hypothetical protein